MSISILVDMNLSMEWVALLGGEGWQSVHWSQVGDPRAEDGTIMAWARSNRQVVFTHDLDFGTALALTHANGPSVIQVRGQKVLPEHLGGLVIATIRKYEGGVGAGCLGGRGRRTLARAHLAAVATHQGCVWPCVQRIPASPLRMRQKSHPAAQPSLQYTPNCSPPPEGKAMNTNPVRIVDLGRGAQIDGHRLTVMDVFYYLHRGYDFDFIHQAMPTLTRAQFDAVVEYVSTHHDELVEKDRRVDDFHQRGMEAQRARGGIFAASDESLTSEERIARLKEKMTQKQAEKTVPVVLIDANIEGQGAHIWMRMQTPQWRDITAALDVTLRTFREVGLDPASPDDVVWRFCQAHGHYLLTSNRNEDSEDSLEATLRREGTPTSLPVFTLPLPDRVYDHSTFLERVVEKLLDYFLFADNIRGTGRLYLP